MSRSAAILFTRVGQTKTGRGLYKLCGAGGKPFGRAFCIKPENVRAIPRKRHVRR